MAITVTELIEKLKGIDELSLLEALEITAEDIVERFTDKIEERLDTLLEEFEIIQDKE